MINKYPAWFIYIFLISLSFGIVLRRNNWFYTWIGFELSLIGFIPIFSQGSITTEGLIKYFLIQSGGSAIFILSFITHIKRISANFFIISMLLKLGIFPFHQWVAPIIAVFTWNICIILTTFQKLAPIFVIISINDQKILIKITMLASISIFVRNLIALNQTIIKPLIAYSSISHSRWLTLARVHSEKITWIYILTYFPLTIALFNLFQKEKTDKLFEKKISTTREIKITIILLTIAGIPPFSVFYLKIIIILIVSHIPVIIMFALIGTLFSTFYYISFLVPKQIKIYINMKLWRGKSIIPILLINLTPLIILL